MPLTNIAETLLVPEPQVQALSALPVPLLAWYDRHARTLPWRQSPTPYRVWVSEIMLQQTRVEAVRGYYRRFLQAFPSVRDLAAAPEDAVLKLWEGLGYYSRARNLHRAAKQVVEQHGGALPASYSELLALPGIGEYTAGAIASIAFGMAVPAADGNVYRVLARMLGSYADTTRQPVRTALRRVAGSMLPEDRPGDFNQALMELGALVCLPGAAPLCASCPAGEICVSYDSPAAAELPVRTKKKPRRVEKRTIVLIVSRQGLLLFRRGNTGLLARMHEPLNLPHTSQQGVHSAVQQLGGTPCQICTLEPEQHIFSHVEWQMDGYLVYSPVFATADGVWADWDALENTYALPSAFAAYLRQLEALPDHLPPGC